MKVKIPLLVLLLLAGLTGYLMGTEAGNAQRNRLLVMLGRKDAEAEAALDLAEAVIEATEEA